MKRFGNITFKRTVAAIFIAALTFVYAEKLIHKHEGTAIHKTDQTSLTRNFDYKTCTLCDFQPVPASELPVIAECPVPVKFVFTSYLPVTENYYYCFLSHITGRGPPAA